MSVFQLSFYADRISGKIKKKEEEKTLKWVEQQKNLTKEKNRATEIKKLKQRQSEIIIKVKV